MRLKLLSPGEMNESQRQTYDESIAGRRGKPPAPMMAWLNSPDMARHATRLGEVLRYDTIFPAKLSEIAILVTARHWTAHYEWYAHKRLALAGNRLVIGLPLALVHFARRKKLQAHCCFLFVFKLRRRGDYSGCVTRKWLNSAGAWPRVALNKPI